MDCLLRGGMRGEVARIGLIADIHACAAPLKEALSLFRSEGVGLVVCLGDIAGYGTELEESVKLLKQSGCITLLGNHESWYLDKMRNDGDDTCGEFFSTLPVTWEQVVEGVRVFGVHASPPDSVMRGMKLLDENGTILPDEKKRWAVELSSFPFNILLVGHTHQVFAEWLGEKLVINPGSTKFNHSCAILDLPDKEVRIIPLSGKEIVPAWNWGMMSRD